MGRLGTAIEYLEEYYECCYDCLGEDHVETVAVNELIDYFDGCALDNYN